jgi:hypothetical protein
MVRIALGAGLLLTDFSFALACGGARWPVEMAADQGAVLISDFVRTAAVADLSAITAPSRPDSRPKSRFAPTETALYEISGTLTAIEKEPNGDYRLVIADPDNPQITMIAVSPDPACASGSRFTDNVAAVRHVLDRKFGQFQRLTPSLPLTATGITFFGTLRGQEGAAPNGIELHPLTGVFFAW